MIPQKANHKRTLKKVKRLLAEAKKDLDTLAKKYKVTQTTAFEFDYEGYFKAVENAVERTDAPLDQSLRRDLRG